MSTEFHIRRGEEQFGPYPEEIVAAYLKAGNLLPTDLHWYDGMAEWKPLSDLNLAEVYRVPITKPNLYEVWEGKPSHWNWLGEWVVSILLIPVFGAGLVGIFMIFMERKAVQYKITADRVTAKKGIFLTKSTEVRIKDIRNIKVESGWFTKVGSVEIFSANGTVAEVVLKKIPNAQGIAEKIRRLQP